jgi:hypothetical protein
MMNVYLPVPVAYRYRSVGMQGREVWSCEKGSGGGGRGDSGRGEGRRWCVLGGIGRERSVCTVCTIECTGRQYRTNLLYCYVFGYRMCVKKSVKNFVGFL